jgi:multidrug efflux pump
MTASQLSLCGMALPLLVGKHTPTSGDRRGCGTGTPSGLRRVQVPNKDTTALVIKWIQPSYRLEIGGAVEDAKKGNASLFALFPVMVLAMLSLLMIQLQSFARLFLVFLTAPLGLIGASLSLNLSGKPFGFVALLGLIALAGMIMRNSVILVDQIETNRKSGRHTLREAIAEATVRRARPVVLTALAAILAMIPLSRSAFWGPMAITIMGGLFVATFLTLLFFPALYALWYRRHLDDCPRAAGDTAPVGRVRLGLATRQPEPLPPTYPVLTTRDVA